jgi:hypothetical protein
LGVLLALYFRECQQNSRGRFCFQGRGATARTKKRLTRAGEAATSAVRRVTSPGATRVYGYCVELTEGTMFRTVSIATLMGLPAGGTLFAGYSAPDMAEVIFAGASELDRAGAVGTDGYPTDRLYSAPAPLA